MDKDKNNRIESRINKLIEQEEILLLKIESLKDAKQKRLFK